MKGTNHRVERPDASLSCRSRLYRLAPIGVRTPLVESMTGYVARLAEAYDVPVQVLSRDELGPLLARPQLSTANHAASFLRSTGHAINGKDHLAHDTIVALDTLLGGYDLRTLTMCAWADAISSHDLMRAVRTWCPRCYQTWLEAGETPYDPLLWAIAVVTVCPVHHHDLESICPYDDCRRSSPMLAPNVRPGHCSCCGRWLGRVRPLHPSSAQSRMRDVAEQVAVAQLVGELLARASDVSVLPRRQQVGDVIDACLGAASSIRLQTLAQLTGVRDANIVRWREGQVIPTLRQLIKLCRGLGVTPFQALTLAPSHIAFHPPSVPADEGRTSRRQARPTAPFAVERVRALMESMRADNDDPPSMREVCRRVGYSATHLARHFPDLCASIVLRRREHRRANKASRLSRLKVEIRRRALLLHEQGLYPSAVRILARMDMPIHFAESECYETWRDVLRELGWDLYGRRVSDPLVLDANDNGA